MFQRVPFQDGSDVKVDLARPAEERDRIGLFCTWQNHLYSVKNFCDISRSATRPEAQTKDSLKLSCEAHPVLELH